VETNEKVVWTPLKIIQWAVPYLSDKGIKNPKLDVEILISFALKIDRLGIYLQFDRPLDATELSLIRGFLKRRSQFEPIQYITGSREFFGLSFNVSPNVLIPRPETEQLVELGIEFLESIQENQRIVLDLGTGSGCIASSIAKNVHCQVWAIDISEAALKVAKANAEKFGITSFIEWRKGDWFSALSSSDPEKFSLIVCNPPYISLSERDELGFEVKDYEPPEALFGGTDGLTAYVALEKSLKEKLSINGIVLLEMEANRCDKILEIFKDFQYKKTVFKDLQGLPRVLKLENIP
jgi:release factor glutamine methyltransferase